MMIPGRQIDSRIRSRAWLTVGFGCCLLLPFALLLRQPALAADADQPISGAAIYRYYCYQCHGYAGDARTLASRSLAPPPRDFTRTTPEQLPVDRIVETVREGSKGTAMVSFATVLDEARIRAVAEYVQSAFMSGNPVVARYHSAENGWPDHERYAEAYAFVDGSIPISAAADSLSPAQQRGRRLFLSACISCHDQALTGGGDEFVMEPRAVSYPRKHYSHRAAALDVVSGASPYARHDVAPATADLSELALAGRALYRQNCAFCHAEDGTGRNWIGSFLEPHPRDFTAPEFRLAGDAEAMARRIEDGVPGTSMPAWRDVLSQREIEAVTAYVREAFAVR